MIPYKEDNEEWKNGRQPNNRVIKISMILDKKIKWAPEDNGFVYNDNAIKPSKTQVQIVETFYDEKDVSTTNNPAVFETEPKEVAELDIYYEASDAFSAASHGQTNGLKYSNCFSFGNGVESDRIRDDFNAPIIGKGVRASTVLEDQYKEVNKNQTLYILVFITQHLV